MAIQQCGLFKDGVVPVNDDVESEADSLDEDDDANAADDDDNDDDDDAIKSDAELVHQVEAELREPVDQLSADPTQAPRIAIVGRPNVGKSSLLNAVAGEGRSVVSPIAGTTSDPVDQYVLWRGKHPMTLVDTAGIRRRSKHKQGLESISVLWSLKAIELSEVTILMIDAQQGILAQDKRVANFILERHRGVVVVVNKWDGPVALQNSVRYTPASRLLVRQRRHPVLADTNALAHFTASQVRGVRAYEPRLHELRANHLYERRQQHQHRQGHGCGSRWYVTISIRPWYSEPPC